MQDIKMSKIKLTKNWQIKTLGEVCETTSGGTPSRGNKSYYNGTIPWVKSGELNKGVIYDTEEKITEEAIKNSSAKIFPKGTLLIALYGATIGKLAFLGVDAATNQAVCGIYQNEAIESKYLYNFLFHKKQDLVKQGIGGAQPNISQTILKKLEIPLPNLETQQAIVSKIGELFSELDKGIEDLKTAQQQLKTYRQSVLKCAFENLKNEKSIEEITQESLIGLVRSNAFQNFNGIGVSYVKMNNIDMNGYIDFKNLTYIEANDKEVEKYSLKKDDILLNTRNSFELVGKTGIVRENYKNVLFNNNLLRIRVKLDYSPLFILYQLVGPNLRKQMLKEKKATTSVCALYQRDILPLKVKITNIEEQHQIVQEIESRLSVADKMEESIAQSLQQAEALRQSILKKAFSGELV
jgi:type I restriction enzyme S subunit